MSLIRTSEQAPLLVQIWLLCQVQVLDSPFVIRDKTWVGEQQLPRALR